MYEQNQQHALLAAGNGALRLLRLLADTPGMPDEAEGHAARFRGLRHKAAVALLCLLRDTEEAVRAVSVKACRPDLAALEAAASRVAAGGQEALAGALGEAAAALRAAG